MLRKTILTSIVAVASLQAAVTFSAPAAEGSNDVVVLDRADQLHKEQNDSFMIVSGNVRFIKEGMIMDCDSAHYYPETGSFQAFGNVKMEQGDTLFIYSDELDYDAPGQVAFLYADPGKVVRMINRDVTLETDVFRYDVAYEIGSYSTGGVLYDAQNRLTSLEGEYLPSSKDANFYINVHLNSHSKEDTLEIFTDSLFYNTITHIAKVNSPGEIINHRGIIYTSDGLYDTDMDTAALYRRTLITNPNGRTLTADTIYYNRREGIGNCFGQMVMTDSARQASLTADYGFFNQNTDSAYATGRLLIKEYSKGDTLYLHARQVNARRMYDTIVIPAIPADTIAGTPEIAESFKVDTSHVADLWPRVRFYRSDMQGVCDSMRVTSADSTLRLYIHPVVWNAEQQIYGNLIELHLNDSTIDEARLPDYGFISQQIYDVYYNQLAGKQIIARLDGEGALSELDINGNVEMIMYPEEADSTFNKMVTAQSSFLTAKFKDNQPELIKMWPNTPGTATPLFLLRRSQLYLSKFRLFKGIRPVSPADVMIVPKAMEDLMEEGEDG